MCRSPVTGSASIATLVSSKSLIEIRLPQVVEVFFGRKLFKTPSRI